MEGHEDLCTGYTYCAVYRSMFPVKREGDRGPLMVMLHWLGGGAQTWTEFSHGMSRRGLRCAALDLPGFGEAAGVSGYSVDAMATGVVETIRQMRTVDGDVGPWLLAGHSMGGKVATVVARWALDGTAGLDGLRGLVLVSASPPGPEPMEESQRRKMLASLGESAGDLVKDRKHAAEFVDENTGKLALPDDVRDRTIAGVLRMNRTALRQWLEHGSKEDWSERVAMLDVPVLLFAGSEDEALGPAAQQTHTMTHFHKSKLVTLEGAGHLAPLERPGEMVEHVTQFVTDCELPLPVSESAPGPAFMTLMRSKRTSPKTHAVMQERLMKRQDWNEVGEVFTPAEMRTLRSLAERVTPDAPFDVAGGLAQQMKQGEGDGWRFAALPPDAAAWQRGLQSLDVAARRAHGVDFAALFPEQQDALLRQAGAGELGRGVLEAMSSVLGSVHLGEGAHVYSAAEMRMWFEEVRAACAQAYMADPRAMERVGYTGFADDLGFTQIELGQREEFER